MYGTTYGENTKIRTPPGVPGGVRLYFRLAGRLGAGFLPFGGALGGGAVGFP